MKEPDVRAVIICLERDHVTDYLRKNLGILQEYELKQQYLRRDLGFTKFCKPLIGLDFKIMTFLLSI